MSSHRSTKFVPYSGRARDAKADKREASKLSWLRQRGGTSGRGVRLMHSALALLKRIRGGPQATPLQFGDVLRDFVFFVMPGEVVYFSTHPSLCRKIFGLDHGNRLTFTAGIWAERSATVVGSRGGRLWVLLDEDKIARALPLEYMTRCHGYTATLAPGACNQFPIIDTVNTGNVECKYTVSTPSKPFSEDLLNEATTAAATYTAEQREFLQRAPDLFVTLVSESEEAMECEDAHTDRDADARAERVAAKANCAESLCVNDVPSDDKEGEVRPGQHLLLHELDGPGGLCRTVVLSPRVDVTSGCVGWVGEGSVLVDAGGVRNFKASLCASVVL